MNNNLPRIIIPQAAGSDEWVLFKNPVQILTAWKPEEVMSCLKEVEQANNNGLYAAGFISYEAAHGFDSALCTYPSRNLPLVWFGIFKKGEPYKVDSNSLSGMYKKCNWLPDVSQAEYYKSINDVHSYLKAGDTYQVNYTFRMHSDFSGDAWSLFVDMQRAQKGGTYAAYIETEDFAICSASPELFFSLDGKKLVSRPMKGTAKRGLTVTEDEKAISNLKCSAKDQAENVMIVDMIRNDMGRIADSGTVIASKMFEIERFPTVLQMVSTVESKTTASVTSIIKALFPCASITGAPKVRTMEIINELESSPRGIYTGSIGYLAPDRKAWFNVAIRTVMIDKHSAKAEYGIGGGVVWDSTAENEYQEALTKAAILTVNRAEFKLLETILWAGDDGYFLLDRHLKRLKSSAQYFGINFSIDECRMQLKTSGNELGNNPSKIRVLLSDNGKIMIESSDFASPDNNSPWKVTFAPSPIDVNDVFLYHKTTKRDMYKKAKDAMSGFNDVLLWNEKYEVTESTIANIVIEKGGKKITPPVSCGLLAGVFRNYLLAEHKIEEGIITMDDVRNSDNIWLINSVRKWVPVKLVSF